MAWWFKLLILMFMFNSIAVGLANDNLLIIWAMMEMNLVMFCPLLILSQEFVSSASGFKIFVLQSVGGVSLLTIFFVLSSYPNFWSLELFLFMIILFKIGSFPFQSWLGSLVQELSWEFIFILLTIQKFLPLFMLEMFITPFGVIFITLGWIILPILCVNFKSVKKIFTYSSLFLLLGLVATLFQERWVWSELLIIYTLTLGPAASMEGGEEASHLSSPLTGGLWLLVLVSFMGVPPSPGFFLKLEIMMSVLEMGGLITGSLFTVMTMFFLYLYLNMFIFSLNKGSRLYLYKKSAPLLLITKIWFLFMGVIFFLYMCGCNHMKFWILSLVWTHN